MAKVEMMGVATFRWKQHSSKLNLQPILLSHGHCVGVVRGIGRVLFEESNSLVGFDHFRMEVVILN